MLWAPACPVAAAVAVVSLVLEALAAQPIAGAILLLAELPGLAAVEWDRMEALQASLETLCGRLVAAAAAQQLRMLLVPLFMEGAAAVQ